MTRRLLFTLLLAVCTTVVFAQTSFTFTLSKSYRTSAGVFAADGTLLRALWNDVGYPSGTFTESWDGKDNDGVSQPAGIYRIKVLVHNVNYIWDGPIGNTSRDAAGTHLVYGYLPIASMAANDTCIYYNHGYSEGSSCFSWFNLKTPGVHNKSLRSDVFIAYGLICTDGPRIYEADNGGAYGDAGPKSFISVDLASTHYQGTFTTGKNIKLWGSEYPVNVIDYDDASVIGKSKPTHPWVTNAASGLAVEQQGKLLVVAHFAANELRIFDKLSGELLRKVPANQPSQCKFSSQNDLWLIINDGTTVVRYTNLLTIPVVRTTISGFSHALALDADPTDPDRIIVADGGSSQTVKAFNKAGQLLWKLGQEGGYLNGDPSVSNTKFWFWDMRRGPMTLVCIQKDHSFWIGDAENCRNLHFDANRKYLNQISYNLASYSVGVNQTDPTHVFTDFKEYLVDYSKPIQHSWTYIRNWAAGPMVSHLGGSNGIRQVATFPDGHTYMLFAPAGKEELWELPAKGPMRETGFFPFNTKHFVPTLTKDGTIYAAHNNYAYDMIWYSRKLLGSDRHGNLKYADSTIIAELTPQVNDPLPHAVFGDLRTELTSGGVLITNDASNNRGYHLGGIKPGSSKFLWRALPVGTLNRKGNYDIRHGSQYQGDVAVVSGHNVIAGFHGEFWYQTQAGQFMHYWDDGLFIGQFGNPNVDHNGGLMAGFAGNGFNPAICTYKGETYLWVNDESANGPQRWHLSGLSTIRELEGTGSLNSSVKLR